MYHLYKKTKNKKTLCWMQYKIYWHVLKKKSAKKIAWGILNYTAVCMYYMNRPSQQILIICTIIDIHYKYEVHETHLQKCN